MLFYTNFPIYIPFKNEDLFNIFLQFFKVITFSNINNEHMINILIKGTVSQYFFTDQLVLVPLEMSKVCIDF